MATTKIITEVTDLNAASSTNGLKMPTGGAYSGTPTDGMVRNDTTGSSQGSASTMQHYNGTEWKNYENLPFSFSADFLVVAGGGGTTHGLGGGGGAGGYRTSYGTSGGGASAETILTLYKSVPYTVTVGAGGIGNTGGNQFLGGQGQDSVFSTITSTGGGGGTGQSVGYPNGPGGQLGGSGSGGARNNTSPGAGTPNQGFAGGAGTDSASSLGGGGGGGASSVGIAANSTSAGNGGNGISSTITGTAVSRAGGGGGTVYSGAIGVGTSGGGSGGTDDFAPFTAPTHGTANTGGGGGGGNGTSKGQNGGSGIVILRYQTANVSSYAVTGTLDTTADTAYPVANTAYYKLNGDALDSSGNGYNGTASNLSPYAAGRFGQAAVFNGSSSRVHISNLTIPSTTSISMWVKPHNNTTNSHIFASQTSGYRREYPQLIWFPTSSTYNGFAAIFSDGGTPVGGWIVSSSVASINEWHHVVIVKNSNGSGSLYVDNQLIGSSTGGTTYTNTSGFTFGSSYEPEDSGFFSFFDGSIDQVRIFSSALSAGNVTSLYNEGTVVESTDGTDSILQFIGGTGTVTFS